MDKLIIKIPEGEIFDEKTGRFYKTQGVVLELVHSLISISKWESKWNKPYLHGEHNTEEKLDYILCMCTRKNIDRNVLYSLTKENLQSIENYINAPMTATTFGNTRVSPNRKQIITSEVIYSRMFINNIPLECEKWHLNRLLTLIRVCDMQNSPPSKMNKRESAQWAAAQNAARRAKMNTKG